MSEEEKQKFLEVIAEIESNKGRNTAHKTIEKGIHKGDAAYGTYGLMPNTIKDIIKNKKIGRQDEPRYNTLSGLDNNRMADYLRQHPDLEKKLAEDLAGKVLRDTGGDFQKSGYMWNMGHYNKPESITDDKLAVNPYSQKFLEKYIDEINRKAASQPVKPKPVPLKKY